MIKRLGLSVIGLSLLISAIGCQTGAPKVGQFAPQFSLKTLDGEREVSLAKFVDDRPVMLFFGSYT
jgi:hypothetical protein